jgi:hypothetical protein
MLNNLHFNLIRSLFIRLFVLVCAILITGKAYSHFYNETDNELNELENLEYAVYSDFFGTEKLPSFKLPQFFEHAIKARKIFEITITPKHLKQDESASFKKKFGKEISSSLKDFKKRNAKECLVKDKIMVSGMTIFRKEQRDSLLSKGLSEVPSHVTGEYVSISRIGFNEVKDTALFYIIWNGSAVTSYYVMMQKLKDKWMIVNVSMDNMIIF